MCFQNATVGETLTDRLLPGPPGVERHCVNSVSVKYVPGIAPTAAEPGPGPPPALNSSGSGDEGRLCASRNTD